MCDEAGPGTCFAGQLASGTFFGFFFGVASMSVGVGVFAAVPGVAIGVCLGVMTANNPNGPKSLGHFNRITATAFLSTVAAALISVQLMGEVSLVATAAIGSTVTASITVGLAFYGSWGKMKSEVFAQIAKEASPNSFV